MADEAVHLRKMGCVCVYCIVCMYVGCSVEEVCSKQSWQTRLPMHTQQASSPLPEGGRASRQTIQGRIPLKALQDLIPIGLAVVSTVSTANASTTRTLAAGLISGRIHGVQVLGDLSAG